VIVFILLAISTSSLAFSWGSTDVSQVAAPASAPSRAKSPTDIPAFPTSASKVVVTLVTEELLGQLADGVTYMYWTFNGTVPGPLIRLREGQLVEMHVKNMSNSTMTHSIDSHGILGTGGGSVYSQTPPGKESVFQFTALRAGLYIYHCATPDIPTHIANGMYGLMLVEPKEGLPKVDREFYVVQGEFYTTGANGEKGFQPFSLAKANAETPEYIVFNGAVGALTGNASMQAKVGETIRIFFGNAGPNLVSSWHVIGGIFDRVYVEGALVSEPERNIQTTLVPAGGSVMVEFKAEVPGTLTLVDHSLFRIHRGAVGMIKVAGASNPSYFSSIQNATQGPAVDSHQVTMNMTQTSTASALTGSNVRVVYIQNYAYMPAELTIAAGTTVTWVNQDPVGHTVTEGAPQSVKPANQRLFDSSGGDPLHMMNQGQSYSFTFTTPGEFDYYCIPHPYMIGHVKVLPAEGQAASNNYADFTIVLTGREIFAMVAFGLVLLVAMMVIFARKKPTPETQS